MCAVTTLFSAAGQQVRMRRRAIALNEDSRASRAAERLRALAAILLLLPNAGPGQSWVGWGGAADEAGGNRSARKRSG